jgi:hypothetical protein
MSRPAIILCVLLISIAATSAEAKLAGAFRSQYVSSGQKACLDAFGRAGGDRAKLSAFCLCKMNYVADRVTADELAANHKMALVGGKPVETLSASMATVIDAGSRHCVTRAGGTPDAK